MAYSEEAHREYIEAATPVKTVKYKKNEKRRAFVIAYAKENNCSESFVYKQLQYGKLKVI